MTDLYWCLLGIVGSSFFSVIISWLFSSRYSLVADIVTIPSSESRFSRQEDIENKKGYISYDTYVVLKNRGNHSLEMSDFAPLNMPHLLINGGELQGRKNAYYIIHNQDPFAMYNNVRLSYDGKHCIYIEFDLLKAGHSIEVVVHSLFPETSNNKIKLGVAATLKNGKFISEIELRRKKVLIQLIVTAFVIPIFMIIPTITAELKDFVFIIMVLWASLAAFLVNVFSVYHSQKRIRK